MRISKGHPPKYGMLMSAHEELSNVMDIEFIYKESGSGEQEG